MTITSSAFGQNQTIPNKYSYQGGNLSPPLTFKDVPVTAKSLALICHDPDAPMANGFTHWLVWNIPPDTKELEENNLPAVAIQGLSDWGKNTWGGPMPPSGTHRYIFYFYALNEQLKLPTNANKILLEQAINEHTLNKAKLTGLFSA